MGALQIDSISVVAKSPYFVLWSRLGEYDPRWLDELLAEGKLFEHWAHAACFLPIEHYPYYRQRMLEGSLAGDAHRARWLSSQAEVVERVMQRVRAAGPVRSAEFERPGGERGGGWWQWKDEKVALELLFHRGDLMVARRQGFQRLYDLRERVLPRDVLEAPVPAEHERLRRLALKAVRARGALTEAGVVEHWRLRGGTRRIAPTVAALLRDGLVERVAVADGGPPVLVPADAPLELARPAAAVLLSPFDNLLWDRRFARRVLGFEHLIEVYKPAHERRFGYYVLPLLWRDRIVGRADLKAERAEGRLVVRAFHREEGVRASGALDDAFDRALDRLRRLVGLETVSR